jgi:hypothetical protein
VQRHAITLAGLDAVTAAIQWIKKTTHGFHIPKQFKIAIYFHWGGLDFSPYENR